MTFPSFLFGLRKFVNSGLNQCSLLISCSIAFINNMGFLLSFTRHRKKKKLASILDFTEVQKSQPKSGFKVKANLDIFPI